MSEHPRFIMVGGFLGAGKTTTIARLAQRFQSQGKHVVIVTNDQAADLVDTNILRSQGFNVGEVAGSCFCCNFDALTDTVEQLGEALRPDVVLAEPVGSCTDLVATVIRPLQDIYAKPFDIAPYGVIVKPSHGAKILRQAKGGFSAQAEYIFRKQIEEADVVILNRIDELDPEDADDLVRLIDEQFPGRPVIRMSAKTGEGFEAFCDFLDTRGEFGRRLMDVDYDVYAQGEAELGWLNSQLTLTSSDPFEMDTFLLSLLGELQSKLAEIPAETAHLKAIGMWEGFYGVANLVSSESRPQLSLASNGKTCTANIVVNARVAVDPDILAELVRQAIQDQAEKIGAQATIETLQSFRPGRPVPTHRITEA